MEGGLANSLNDPERITSDVFKKGTTFVVLFSIMEDTASDKHTVIDVVEITGVQKAGRSAAAFAGKTNRKIIISLPGEKKTPGNT